MKKLKILVIDENPPIDVRHLAWLEMSHNVTKIPSKSEWRVFKNNNSLEKFNVIIFNPIMYFEGLSSGKSFFEENLKTLIKPRIIIFSGSDGTNFFPPNAVASVNRNKIGDKKDALVKLVECFA